MIPEESFKKNILDINFHVKIHKKSHEMDTDVSWMMVKELEEWFMMRCNVVLRLCKTNFL